MNIIRQWIYTSYMYNFILNICQMASKSFFFKPQVLMGYRERREIYTETLMFKSFQWMDLKLEHLYLPIRNTWKNSFLVGKVEDFIAYFRANTLVGRFVFAISPVYLIPLYVYIDYLMRSYSSPFSSVWDELLAIAFVLWIFARRVIGNHKIVFTSLDIPILLYALVFLFLTLVNSVDLDIGVEGFRADVQYIFWFYLVTQVIDSKKIIYRMLWIFIIGMGLLGLHGIYQYFTGAPMLGNWVDSGETITTRAYSIIRSPNAFASLLVLNIPLAFSLFIVEKDILKKLLALLCLLCMGLGLLFTFSRGAWFFGFLALLLVILFVAKGMIVPIFGVALTALFNISTLWKRISYMFTADYAEKNARGGRAYRWAVGIMEWSKSKWLGLGIGRYGGAVAANHKLTPFYMDNYYIKTLTEAGIIGLTSLIVLMLVTIFQTFIAIRNTVAVHTRILSIGLFAGIMAVVGHNYVENIFETPFMVTYFWTYVALILALNRLDHEKVEIKE